jgi:DNA-binding beta-propeller fold protein YncE
VPLEQALRSPATVRRVAVGDFNWIKSDKTQRVLFGAGHGFNHVRMFDLSDWSKAPVESGATDGWSQSFEYSPTANEVYVYDDDAKRLRYFDAPTLALKRSIDIGKVSPGDTWLAADDRTNTISVVSEADEEVATPLVVVDRDAGRVLDQENEAAGNLTLDPDRSLAYLSFFRRQNRISIYDLRKREVVRTASIGPHADRMGLWKNKNELLVTLPAQSSIARVDADTLELKGYIPADFGVRAIAVDSVENLLFTGSIVTGRLEILDLSTMKRRASFYLGPWLRTIEVIPDRGIAYVSSNGAIFEVRYQQNAQERGGVVSIARAR